MISLVTTYKDRPNYTIVTCATMREAVCLFDEKINFFFYDDASIRPVPAIVNDLGNQPNVEGFATHRNEKSLGAEHGNIDAISKCFEKFPKTTHVLVLDNDLCVHPYALFAIRQMIKDLPKLGFGSIFNSNAFPELSVVQGKYVIKEVNPGLGGVIARDAWTWHLDRSNRLKLNKNPKHPGWDWNLSAWMKDSSNRWEVYATRHSYVEHIGCSGTNVTDDFMTRSRRFYDKVEEQRMSDGRIDILMPVKDMEPDALERMKWCIKSLRTNGDKFRLCISDSSRKSMKDTLDKVIEIPYEYFWEKCDGLFSRSRVINNGVRNLVKSNPFLVMDTDVVVPSNFLDKFLKYFRETGTFVVGRLAYLQPGHLMTDDWSKLYGHPVSFYYNSGFFACDLDLFKKVNGFDERYDGWGAEDDDINLRMIVLTKGKIRKLIGMEMTCWHLYHPRKDVIEKDACDKNRKRYWDRKPLYENGALTPDAVKGLVDRGR